MIITDACNLLCSECSTLCNKDSSYFISIQDFKKQLKQINKIFPSIDTIDITGGESLLHPNFIELCKIAKKECPNKKIAFWTNGILLNQFSKKTLIYLTKTLKIDFKISLYPNLIENFNKNTQNLKEIEENLIISGSRIYFYKQIIDKTGTQNHYNAYKDCYHFKYPYQFYIYKDRIYNCCQAPYIAEKIELKNLNNFSLYIYDILTENEVLNFFNKPLEICKYCGNEKFKEETIPWNNSQKIKKNFTQSLQNLYLFDYEQYRYIYHDVNINNCIRKALNNDLYNKYLLDGNRENIIYHYENRLKKGIIDIIILFDDKIDINLLQQLYNFYIKNKKQFINFHFISYITNNIQNEIKLYNLFYPFTNENISSWFYKIDNNKQLIDIINNLTYSPYIYIYSLKNKHKNKNIYKRNTEKIKK